MKAPLSSLFAMTNKQFWEFARQVDVPFEHHVRPLGSLRVLGVRSSGWHPEHSFKLRAYMSTFLFLLFVCLWMLKWNRRSLDMVEAMSSLLSQVVKLAPDQFDLPVTTFFNLRVRCGKVSLHDTICVLGYLGAGSAWSRLGVQMPDLRALLEKRVDCISFEYLLFAVWRLADHSVDARMLAKSWLHVLARYIDGGLQGKLKSEIPHMVLPSSCRVDTKLAVRSDDKFMLAPCRFLARNSGVAAQRSKGDEVLLKDPWVHFL